MKGDKGITLIALVITIIIMLILAAVTITLALGDDGLIGYARNAGTETNAAAQNDAKVQEGKVTYNGQADVDIGDIANNTVGVQ